MNSLTLGYKGQTTDETVDQATLRYMRYKLDRRIIDHLFIERIEDERVILWDEGVIIREWEWDAAYISCYFEEFSEVILNQGEIDLLKNPEPIADKVFFYAPYVPFLYYSEKPLVPLKTRYTLEK